MKMMSPPKPLKTSHPLIKVSYALIQYSPSNSYTPPLLTCLLFFKDTVSEDSSSEESESSTDFDSSESFEDSSESDLSPDDTLEEDEDKRTAECIVISSDDESMELELPQTPPAPLTPGAELELDLPDWSDSFHRGETDGNENTPCRQDTCDVGVMMDFEMTKSLDVHPPSPLRIAGY